MLSNKVINCNQFRPERHRISRLLWDTYIESTGLPRDFALKICIIQRFFVCQTARHRADDIVAPKLPMTPPVQQVSFLLSLYNIVGRVMTSLSYSECTSVGRHFRSLMPWIPGYATLAVHD